MTSPTALARRPAPERATRLRVWLDRSWFALLLPPTVCMDIRVVLDEYERLRREKGEA